MEAQTKNVLKVEFIQVEMPANADGSCSACDTIQGKLVSAVQAVQKLFDNLDCEIFLKSTTIRTVQEAEKVQIVASPTIRVGNLDFHPHHPTDNSEKREWTWKGATIAEPDKKTLIEVLLRGYFEPQKEHEKKELSPYILKYLDESEQTKSDCGCS
ncbi:DUF2703 domain-containing protein [Sphingobacterium gobiense]|uniref:DUF2703 domain-containing protein n=1 Tax=Sphingobacterium gobiense TaxID=1382456 RepID=A0A2S9JN51_9SPHI|nr:DUF2703 domain-containing protein [Sphingobacterium gobiense]PRD54595.1 hypothetical protein C5749_14215 [Sphingobacterium gobiense]